jgi:tetratricopeptide (TPR) repeat protein
MKILFLIIIIVSVILASGCVYQKTAEQWYKEGLNKAAHNNGCEAAIVCYDKALEIDPRFSEAWFAKGVCYQNLQQYNKSIECYDNAIEINPQYALAYYQKSKVMLLLGLNKDAEDAYNKAIAIDPRLINT